jgi:hypothetical protein
MHVVRCIVVTPINKLSYLNAALIDLHYAEYIERFGMFFLPDIELDKDPVLSDLETKDDKEVERVMQLEKKKHRRHRERTRIVNTEPTARYPYGESPSWPTVVKALRDSPQTLVANWMWPDEEFCRNQEASDLFVQMTVDLWLSLSDTVLCEPNPHPTTLEEVMEAWSVQTIHKKVHQGGLCCV